MCANAFKWRAQNLRGRAQGLIGLVLCYLACPLPDCTFWVLSCVCSLAPLLTDLAGLLLAWARRTEQFSITCPETRSDLMHIQGSYFGKLFGFFYGLLGIDVAAGPFRSTHV